MIFTIGVVTAIVGLFVFKAYQDDYGPHELCPGEYAGVFITLAGVAMVMFSCLFIAWHNLP